MQLFLLHRQWRLWDHCGLVVRRSIVELLCNQLLVVGASLFGHGGLRLGLFFKLLLLDLFPQPLLNDVLFLLLALKLLLHAFSLLNLLQAELLLLVLELFLLRFNFSQFGFLLLDLLSLANEIVGVSLLQLFGSGLLLLLFFLFFLCCVWLLPDLG